MSKGVLTAVMALSVVGATVPAVATPWDFPARLQAAVNQLVAGGFPGVVAYVRDGEQAWRVTAGVSDRDTGRPARPGDRFRIASNTKSFTAAVVLQLSGEGRLSLDDNVDRWLPGIVTGNGNDGSRITIRQLLNHTSGVYDPASEPGFFAPYLERHDWDYVYTPREVVRLAMAHPPTTEAPGTQHQYSNTNYLLAGMVIKAVTGHSPVFEIYKRLIVPLGLWHTWFPTTDPEIHGPHLHGYDLGGNDVTRFSPSYDWTAGALVSTVDELARFHRALLSGRLLDPVRQRELTTVVPDGSSYGLGVQRRDLPCGTAWGHDGGGPGFTSMSLSTADGRRQLVLVGNVFDLGKDLRHEPPIPVVDPTPLLMAALCG
jgi:D-alanyl-D-alanine carboxypeptidase